MSKKLVVKLRTGESLKIKKLGLSGYVSTPAGGLILGGASSRSLVGKFCIGVCYTDGQSGVIAQEEIAEIRDAKGKKVPYGDAKYPGHPDFDPRDSFDPIRAQIQSMRWMSKQKRLQRTLASETSRSGAKEEPGKKSKKSQKTSAKKQAGKKSSKKASNNKSTKKKRGKKK